MADRSMLCCEELINFTAGGFPLKQALTQPPSENTSCPGLTLGLGHSFRVTPGCIILHHEYLCRSLVEGNTINIVYTEIIDHCHVPLACCN